MKHKICLPLSTFGGAGSEAGSGYDPVYIAASREPWGSAGSAGSAVGEPGPHSGPQPYYLWLTYRLLAGPDPINKSVVAMVEVSRLQITQTESMLGSHLSSVPRFDAVLDGLVLRAVSWAVSWDTRGEPSGFLTMRVANPMRVYDYADA